MRIVLKIILGFIALMVIAGCTVTSQPITANSYPIPPNYTFCSQRQQQILVNDLQGNGVQINYLGDYLIVVFPSQLFFMPESSMLKKSAYSQLVNLSALLACYKKLDLKVTVYNGDFSDPAKSRLLSQIQAQTIADILSGYGINTSIIAAQGKGMMSCDISPIQRSRIEIATQLLP